MPTDVSHRIHLGSDLADLDRAGRGGRSDPGGSTPDIRSFPRVALAHLPTPLEDAPSLAAAIGVRRLLVKRDDCTGLGGGGNKVRKLEFLLGATGARDADVVVTGGATQSNHARLTAAACAKLDLRCELILTTPLPSRGSNYALNGNRLLDSLFGARCVTVQQGCDLDREIERHAQGLRERGERVSTIPVGGSNGLGSIGYADAAFELLAQLRTERNAPAHLVLATGSGGTQAGVLAGFALAGVELPVIGISVGAQRDRQVEKVWSCAVEVGELLGRPDLVVRDRIVVHDDYVGSAYGDPTTGMVDAVSLAARAEGLLLDPVYTGKALAGLIGLRRQGVFGPHDDVVFLHTGGMPGLFAYDKAFDRTAPRSDA